MTPTRALLVGCLVLSCSALSAQESRQDVLAAERRAKAEHLEPYEPGRIENWLLKIENEQLLQRFFLESSSGFYPRLGSFTRGGGLAFGPGYRRIGLFDIDATLDLSTAVSLKKYWLAEVSLDMPSLGGGRVFSEVHARHLDFPQEDFFGIGPQSNRPDRVSYGYRSNEIGGEAGVRVTPWLSTGGALEWMTPRVGRGDDPRFLSIEELFPALETPGFDRQPDFLRSEWFVDLNYATPRGNPRSGGRYLVSIAQYNDVDFDAFGFRRVDIDLRQYLPVLKARRVFALRGLLSASDAPEGQTVPFYLQRTLGGSDTLRGFREFRFRDDNLLLLQAEYRWEIFPALDGALFYDAGMVAPELKQLGIDGLQHDYGFGFRFGTNDGVFLRIDTAFGSREGKHFWFRFGHVF